MEPEGVIEQEESPIEGLSGAATYRLVYVNRLEIMHEVGEILLVTTAGVRRVLLLFGIAVFLLPTIRI
ncbi:MAG: hypothetical protein A2Z71_10570 [Chloroflexi bacterium RBG_13_50_21]|nr:MAG: hypothetical protein A2Z71_10570 [Chloroflexi bacterium RBG_13_50_21]OGO66784.1 MAG: hypothetical protein A2029_03345 [Chloroflexi bacterium RBG_19FT_COMBO_47_9]